jgi:hypothetical protein
MTTNRWIKNSRSVYQALLRLYPKEHCNHYGAPMLQVFTDQCQDAYQLKGWLGIILLWLRTLPDLGHTLLLEHITAPGASWGLMEPVPNAPLPWKGVLLVLLPGLFYLISQIVQLTGEPWYLTIYYRAAFLLIIPVLIVWVVTRRFPIWGLIPLGLLYRLVQEIGYQVITLHPGAFSSNPLLNAVLTAAQMVEKDLAIPVIIFTTAILFLAWRYIRQQKPSSSFWVWMGIFLLIAAIKSMSGVGWIIPFSPDYTAYMSPDDIQSMFRNAITWDLYNASALLLLIFIGTLFTRRHGLFAIMIPVGYILPTILFGLMDADDPTNNLVIISFAVLAYRALLSLITPIWMSRTISQTGKKRVVIISITLALGIHMVLQLYQNFVLLSNQGYFNQTYFNAQYMRWGIDVTLDALKIISAIILGLSMYQNTRSVKDVTTQSLSEYPEISIEKA